uniref:Uncharacterized protein n=1 Tax=viral metagenome TaxID=1070528 RepID=A0A6C0JE79_9ZZZZ
MQKHYKSKSNKNATKKSKHQKMYKMRGCSKKSVRNHLGGNNSTVIAAPQKPVGADFSLAYPYNGPTVPNTALAYTGKGGYKCPNGVAPGDSNLGVVTTSNVNGANPLYPNTGPPFGGFNFLNPVNQQRGGGCGCGLPFMSGGGGSHKHREQCKCSKCKTNMMSGGGGCNTGNNGIPYPNGLVGKPYVNSSNLPGANGIPGDANYYFDNKYYNDVSRQMINVGANPPFLGFLGFKGGRKHNHTKKKHMKKQHGGTLSNFIGQDLINLGRQFTYGAGSAFNALNGNPAPTNPLPWKGQLVGKH